MNDNFKQAFENAAKIAPDTLPLETIDETTIFGDGNDIISDITTPPPPPPPFGNNNQLGGQQQPQQGQQQPQQNLNMSVVPAQVAINVVDTAGSTIVATLCRLAGMNIRAKELKMNAAEKKQLEEPTQALLQSINIVMSPVEVFLISLGSIYANKVIEIRAQQQDREPIDINDRNELSNEKKPRKPRNDAGKPRAKRS